MIKPYDVLIEEVDTGLLHHVHVQAYEPSQAAQIALDDARRLLQTRQVYVIDILPVKLNRL